jgi:hypothetical protein
VLLKRFSIAGLACSKSTAMNEQSMFFPLVSGALEAQRLD